MNAIFNTYEDRRCAEGYARLEFPGCYYLAFRDLPELIQAHAPGVLALDFGCGAGRSSRFLEKLGKSVIGVDISPAMLRQARLINPRGDYRQLGGSGMSIFPDRSFHLILSAFTFDNIPTVEKKTGLFADFRRLLESGGAVMNLVSRPEIYWHEWASFSTRDFPENKLAKDGDVVRIINTDSQYSLPVEDILWSEAAYLDVYDRAGLMRVESREPLGDPGDGYSWINETRIAPWRIDVLKKK